jgi:CXXX repeat peptide maturase
MEESKIQSVIIISGGDAPSFCYYETGNKPEVMPTEMVEKSIEFCRGHQLSATIVYNSKLAEQYSRLIDDFPHIKIVSSDALDKCDISGESDFVVMDDTSPAAFEIFNEKLKYNIIMRIHLSEAKRLPLMVYRHHRLFKRLNVVFKDVPDATEEALNRFRIDIQPFKEVMVELFRSGNLFECNMITDRMVLTGVNSCNAGISHVTIAPDGNFYLCPAFYYHNEHGPVGSLDTGVHIANERLLRLEYAPLCRLCDCYQCKRCVFLNKRMTHELNTPSHQQCVLSHHERNLSGMLLQKLQNRGTLADIKEIPPLFHLDPADIYQDSL